jgi:hypothetical protein
MPDKHPTWEEIERDRDEAVNLPLDPETALRGLLAVSPDSEPAGKEGEPTEAGSPRKDC